MATTIFSASWYRVAALKPKLRTHAQIHRHEYRGETWYVLQDLTMERFLRFSPAVYSMIGMMDGQRTVEEIWRHGCSRLGDDAPTQDEMIQVLTQLYRADVLQCDVTPDAAELLQRHQEQARRRWQGRVFSLFSWRFPLFDPERFLRRTMPLMRPLFGWFGAVLWLVVVVPALVLVGAHWSDLTMNVLDHVLVPQNLLALWLLFPLIKAFHEFGHAFATKAFGGEVHEMGVMLLVLTPVPYVDASSAWAFRSKWQRVLVGAAGMLVELFIAALALFIWLAAEPGVVRGIAYNAIFIAGLSTILFNANPLLRYDGYYILADWIEIPNLRPRSSAYLGYLGERYLFGNHSAEAQPAKPEEKIWFVGWGVASFFYRIIVVVAILIYLAEYLFSLGALLAAVAAVVWGSVPVVKGLHFLFTHARIQLVRSRAIGVTAAVVLLVAGLIGVLPLPYRTDAEGVVWIPEEAFVRAGAEGFISTVAVLPGTRVRKGDPLISLANPTLTTQEQVLAAHLRELEARFVQYLSTDPVKAETTQDEIRYTRARLHRVREQLDELTIRSATSGTFVVPAVEDLPGRFAKKGELLGYVVELGTVTVRTVVSQTTFDLVRGRTRGVEVRLSERIAETVPAVVRRIVPGASEKLPTRALGTAGGGEVALNPSDGQGMTAVQRVFQIDLELSSQSKLINLGGRSYVRFDHGWAPLGVQWYRKIRQLFLSRFNV
jgi:putative peptide zinc metalloprotease protein